MRISDLSSDVCSSDLLRSFPYRISPFRDYNARMGTPGHWCVPLRIPWTYPGHQLKLNGSTYAGCAKRQHPGIHCSNDRPLHCLMPRSEEHTSELQSLMRISYAVFCLKKKKKQYQQ